MPGPFQPIFDSAVCGQANGYIVNNVSRALVGSSLTENERASMLREVIQSVDL